MLIRSASSKSARCAVAVMAKASHPGRTKTRLVPPLTYAEAAEFNTAFIKDIAANLAVAGAQADIATYIAYSPAGEDAFFRANLDDSAGLLEICHPNFGDCLFETIDELLRLGHEAAIVLNSDSPTLPTRLLVQAAEAFASPGDRSVLGPCNDGGYYLLGLKQAHRRAFDEIRWSTDVVAAQTRERIAELKLECVELAEWYDVDDIHALRLLHAETQLGHGYAADAAKSFTSFAAPHASALMRRLIEQQDGPARLGLTPGLKGQTPELVMPMMSPP